MLPKTQNARASRRPLAGLPILAAASSTTWHRPFAKYQLCSNDPICAKHRPDDEEGRFLHGAACHGCLFLPETSCEIRNDFLDRALVVPTMATGGAAFFKSA